MADTPQEVELWPLVKGCKSRRDFVKLQKHTKADYDALVKLADDDPSSITLIRRYGARMCAWGIVRGMQFAVKMRRNSESTIADSIVKHASVAKLLKQVPKVSSSNICNALERVDEPLPWRDLRRQNRLWSAWSTHPTVKVAISNARKTALQMASDTEWLDVIKGVGEEGSIFSDFEFDKRRVMKRRVQPR